MDYKETDFSFLYDNLTREYGNEQGKQLYILMCEKYTNLCEHEIKSENQEMNKHIFKRLLPIMGIYLTLANNGFTKEQALMITIRKYNIMPVAWQKKMLNLQKCHLHMVCSKCLLNHIWIKSIRWRDLR